MCWAGTVLQRDINRSGKAKIFSHLVSVEGCRDRWIAHFSIGSRKWHHHVVDYIVRPVDLIPTVNSCQMHDANPIKGFAIFSLEIIEAAKLFFFSIIIAKDRKDKKV